MRVQILEGINCLVECPLFVASRLQYLCKGEKQKQKIS